MKTLILFGLVLLTNAIQPAFGQSESETEAPPPPASKIEENRQAPKQAWRGKQNGRYGYYTSADWVIPGIYDELSKEYSDFMIAKKDKKYGIIDRLNREVLPFEYDRIYQIKKNYKTKEFTDYYMLLKGATKGIIHKNGKMFIEPIYTHLALLAYPVYCAGKADGTYGLLNIEGREIHPFTLQSQVTKGIGETFIAQKNDKTGTIDKMGKTMLPFKYEAITLNHSYDGKIGNLYIITLEGKSGVMDEKENIIIPLEYEEIRGTTFNQLLSIRKEGQYGVCDRKGKLMVPARYQHVKQYGDNFFLVKKEEVFGLINPQGNEVVAPTYNRLERKSKRYFSAELEQKGTGVVDTLGKQVLACGYRKLRYSAGKLLFAAKLGERLMSVYDENGQQLKGPSYYEVQKGYHFSIVQKEQRGPYALFHNPTVKELTSFIYSRIRVSTNTKDKNKLVIKAERNGLQVELSETGKEVGNPRISRAEAERLLSERRQKAFERGLTNSNWLGLIEINGQYYIQQLTFATDKTGSRKVFFFEKEKVCFVGQNFELVTTDYKNFYLKLMNSPVVGPCKQALPKGISYARELMKLETPKLNLDRNGAVNIQDFEKTALAITSDPANFEAFKKIKELKVIAADLSRNIEPKPGGVKDPSIMIEPNKNQVFLFSYGVPNPIATLVLEEEETYIQTEFWENENHYSLAGIWHNVRYLSPEGKVKTGDLDICFKAEKQQKIWLKEIQK